MSRIHRILFPTDLSECSGWAYAYAARLATKFSADLYALHIRLSSREDRDAPASPTIGADEFCLPLVEGLTEIVEEVDAASAPRAIVRYAERHDVDLIVMGARGRSGRHLPELGHVAEAVVRHAPCPVLTVRNPMASAGLRRVLVPVDFSETSRAALTQAKWVAAWFGAQLDLLYVIPVQTSGDAAPRERLAPACATMKEDVQARLIRFATTAPGPDVAVVLHVCEGKPAAQIVALVQRLGSDLVVLGTQGERQRRPGAIGSVAERVVHTAPCPVLAVKGRVRQAVAEPKTTARRLPVAG